MRMYTDFRNSFTDGFPRKLCMYLWQTSIVHSLYVATLRCEIVRIYSELFTFQQDAAPAHRARETVDLRKQTTPKMFYIPFWPSNSPDRNPHRVHRLYGVGASTRPHLQEPEQDPPRNRSVVGIHYSIWQTANRSAGTMWSPPRVLSTRWSQHRSAGRWYGWDIMCYCVA